MTGSKSAAIANTRRLLQAGDWPSAAEQAREILSADDRCAESQRLLGIALRAMGNLEGARQAEIVSIAESALNQDVFQATLAIADNRFDRAEAHLRAHLKEQPDDACALRLLAEVAARVGRLEAAEKLAKQALKIAPEYSAARKLLDGILVDLRARAGRAPSEFPRASRASNPSAADQYDEALKLYTRVVERYPSSPQNWVSYGDILRTIGRRDEAIEAYRHAIGLKQDSGEAWWALADLKTHGLGLDDIDRLSAIIDAGGIGDEDLPRLHFALGRALELAGRHEEAFRHYEEGNRLRCSERPLDRAAIAMHAEAPCRLFDRAAVSKHVDASIRLFSGEFLRSRQDSGFEAPDPIFVLGMPRAGSTLVEQILASHRDVEGTMELPDISGIANWLAGGKRAGFEFSDYLDAFASLSFPELLNLGKGYIWGTGLRRQTAKPFFIDKMPNNWLHLGMILTILPNAKIIDARRHPMACGFSIFRQHFPIGQEFSYDLVDIGSFYFDYVRMMAHFDRVAPGRVIRVIHEDLAADPEAGIRTLLERLGLPFDEACRDFHKSKRAVHTSSSEQVRRPINREGLDQWRAFEPWLGPLKEALGPVLDCYPSVPDQF